jgi:hypothetical protein
VYATVLRTTRHKFNARQARQQQQQQQQPLPQQRRQMFTTTRFAMMPLPAMQTENSIVNPFAPRWANHCNWFFFVVG